MTEEEPELSKNVRGQGEVFARSGVRRPRAAGCRVSGCQLDGQSGARARVARAGSRSSGRVRGHCSAENSGVRGVRDTRSGACSLGRVAERAHNEKVAFKYSS